MPISDYYGGHGSEVIRKMEKRYGRRKGKRVFYATANKRDQGPEGQFSTADVHLPYKPRTKSQQRRSKKWYYHHKRKHPKYRIGDPL